MISYRSQDIGESIFSLLRPEDAKRHAEDAWRYIHKINPVTATRLWTKYHPGEPMPKGCTPVYARVAA